MKHLPLCPPRGPLAIVAVAFALALLASPAAQAFTLDSSANTTAAGTARYADPDEQFSGGNGQGTTIHNGAATLQFGSGNQQSDDQAAVNRMFDPLGRPGDPR